MKIKNVIFDYGGTLDTGGTHWADIIYNAYRRHAVLISEADFKKAYIIAEKALTLYHLVKPSDTFKMVLFTKIRIQLEWMHDHGHIPMSTPQMKTLHKEIVEELYAFARQHTNNALRVITALKASGINVALVSNFYGNLRTVLREMGLSESFDCIIESAEVGIRKPDPRIYALAGERMGIREGEESSVVVVGDSLQKDILPASSLGFQTVWIRSSVATSSGIFSRKAAPQAEASATHTISCIQQLLPLIGTNYNHPAAKGT